MAIVNSTDLQVIAFNVGFKTSKFYRYFFPPKKNEIVELHLLPKNIASNCR